jgi:hypothetical protein
MLLKYLIAEHVEKRPVIYAVATTYGVLLVLQPFFRILSNTSQPRYSEDQ